MAHDIDDYDDDAVVKSGKGKGKYMEMGAGNDKTVINLGGGSEGGGGAGLAAVIAALGNRNQGGDNAALIAALGNRNDDSSNWAPLMAMMNRRDDHDGGMNNMWPIILLALLGRGKGGGGLFGGGDDCGGGGDAVNQLTLNQVLAKLGTLEGQVPLVGSQVQNSILEQTNALTNIANQNNIAQLVATAGVKDSVVNTGSVLLNAGSQNTQAILQAVAAVGTKIDTNTIADLQRQLSVAQNLASDERHHRHSEAQKVEVTQTVTQNQAQLQAQLQTQRQEQSIIELGHLVRDLVGDIQAVKQGQTIFNSGLMSGSGTQAAANTKVN
jgi:hypothetical protein